MADAAHTTPRRAFLKGIMVSGALLPLAGAAVAASAAAAPRSIRQIYAEWRDAFDACNTHPTAQGPEYDALFDRYLGLHEEAARFQPVTAEDWAFKVALADCEGDMCMNAWMEALAAQAWEAVARLGGRVAVARRKGLVA